MNGAAMIKALERLNPEVRVISASGLEGKPQNEEAPFRVTLPKPFTAEQLLKTVQRLLQAA
jgi:CheY-like chemotaxis protein